jgi:alpha-ketoglutarate-dependent taurine dioxygenase
MKSSILQNHMPEVPRLMKRKAITLGQTQLVKEALPQESASLPLILEPAQKGMSLGAWAASEKESLQKQLARHGAILFRNFQVAEVESFEQFIRGVSGDLLEYHERSSPRHQVSGNVYTSTDYPATQSIFLHNENSYQHTWPLKIFFFCRTPAHRGGETPIADVRRVLQRIDPKIQERFLEKGVMYVRNYDGGLGLSWQTVFQSDDRAVVNKYCRHAGVHVEWRDENRLRTRQVGQAITNHPQTGEAVWFNHAAFFHVTTLDPMIREVLLDTFIEEDLPNNTYYGDGSPIELSVLDEIREAYRQERTTFTWREGDVLMLDNMLTAHGRNPYGGPRKILVGMSELFTRPSI